MRWLSNIVLTAWNTEGTPVVLRKPKRELVQRVVQGQVRITRIRRGDPGFRDSALTRHVSVQSY